MTGFDVAKLAGIPVIVGEACAFDWWSGVIVLTREVASSSRIWAQLCAAHEAAHVGQYHQAPWRFWFRWLGPVGVQLEYEAWQEAVRVVDLIQRPSQKSA